MRPLLERLHSARLTLASLDSEWARAREAFEAANAELAQRRANTQIELDAADQALRKAAITAFRETGDLAPGPGVKVQMVNRMEYDPEEAQRWAVNHKMAVSLDVRAFEKIAKAAPLDFVRLYQEPRVTIATDLGPMLDGMEE